jgi:undecaprenyl-phosphate galactose phosphotransferase
MKERKVKTDSEAYPNNVNNEQVVNFAPLLRGSDAIKRKIRKYPLSLYKLALLTHDIIVANLFLAFCAVITGINFFSRDNFSGVLVFLLFSLITIAFFSSYNLYNHHLIFSKKGHQVNLIKAFICSLFSLSIVFSLCIWPALATAFLFIAIGMVLLSKFLLDKEANILRSVGISFMAFGILTLIDGIEELRNVTNYMVILANFLISVGIFLFSRRLLIQLVFNKWLRRHFRRQILVIGSDQEAKHIVNFIIDNNAPFWVAGIVGNKEEDKMPVLVPKKYLGELKDLPVIVNREKIDELIVTDEGMDKRTLISLLDYCTSEGLTVWFPPKLMPIIVMKLYIDNFCGLPMIRMCSQKNSWLFTKIKHGLDEPFAILIFLFLLPLFLVIAVAIKLNSPGPVFYRAKTIGRRGKAFTMYKFRSMKVNNGADIHRKYVTKLIKGELYERGKIGRVFKIIDDPRITKVGNFLRKYSLDELPQIINVIKGDMSLVGPRPCLPYEYEVYKDWHKKRLFIRPGISGLWQVAGRSAVTFEDMVLLDLYYIYNRCLVLDLIILYETFFAVIQKRGAY